MITFEGNVYNDSRKEWQAIAQRTHPDRIISIRDVGSVSDLSDVVIDLINDIDIIRVDGETAKRIEAEVTAHVQQTALLDRLEMIVNELANLVLRGD